MRTCLSAKLAAILTAVMATASQSQERAIVHSPGDLSRCQSQFHYSASMVTGAGDILVPGHGPLGTKAHAREHRDCRQALYEAVLAGARAGQALDDMQRTITLDQLRHLGQYDARHALDVAGAHHRIMLHGRGN